MDERISEFLLELYRASREILFRNFQSCWGNAFEAPLQMHRMHLHDCVPDILEDVLRRLIHIDPLVAVNNALIVDVTSQISAESFDHRPHTGVGGQTVFMLPGAHSPNGESISVVPSSPVPSNPTPSNRGPRVNRIVAFLPRGTPATVLRTYVDQAVTEYGIAELRGNSLPQRVHAIIDIAHPDFRDHLKDQAKRMYRV